MFKATLVLLVLTALMLNIDPTEAGRRRRRFWRRLGRAVGKVLSSATISVTMAGKRAAGCEDLTQQEAAQVVEELEKQCPNLAVDPAEGLPRAGVDDAFEQMDVNKDDALSGQELEKFRQLIDAYDICLNLEGAKKK